MTEEDYQGKIEEMRQHRDVALKKAESSAFFWKWAAIAILLFSLFAIADLRGCIPAHPDGWTEPTP